MRKRLLVLGMGLALAACSSVLGPRPDPTRFYVLTPLAERETAGNGALRGVTLGLGPIRVPAYLRRTEMVTRLGPNRVELSDYERWAEPLDAHVGRVLAADLTTLLEPRQIVSYPSFAGVRADYQVEVDLRQFERDQSGGVELAAGWVIRDGQHYEPLESGETIAHETTAGRDIDAAVAAQSRALGQLARDLAAAVRRVHAARRVGT